MATILSQYSTTGFYKAPISKGIMGCMFLSCTALNVPLLAHLKQYLRCQLPDDIIKGEVWRILSSKLSFIDTKDLVCGSLLIYYFRVFERRYGSQKFGSCLVASQIVTVFLEVISLLILLWMGIDLHGGGYLPPGPYGVIFPLFVAYYFDIPRVTQTSIFGVPITGKTLTYLLGLQVCSTSAATAISAACGVVAGLIYQYNILGISSYPWVPDWLAKVCSVCLGPLLRSYPPKNGPMGATLELQRQEQIEIWEQQMIMNRAREARLRGMPGGAFNHNTAGAAMRQQDYNNAPHPSSESQVQSLVEMGFDRQRVIRALSITNYDVNNATNLLLQESGS